MNTNPVTVNLPLDITKFKVGDMVWVAYNVRQQQGWKPGYNDEMDAALGKKYKVLNIKARDGYQLDTLGKDKMSLNYWFPDGALRSVDEKIAPKTGDLGPHDPNKFPIGSKVRIVRRVDKQEGWNNSWGADKDGMDLMVGDGKTYTVTETDASGYWFKDTRYWWPSGALELAEEGVKVTLVIEKGGKKKRRVRVGPGPWDAAPCTHLRWHLMGFFREKLAFKKTKTMVKAPLPDGTVIDVEADIASVQVVCTKCGTTMTLNAK